MGQSLNIGIGLVIGALIVIQGGMNARLMSFLGGSTPTTLVNFAIGTVVLLAATVVTGQLTAIPALVNAPRWSLLGGCAGALLVMGTAFLIPRLGTANMVALVVCGQALTGLIVDHYGLLGVPQIDITVSRLVGCGLLVVGAVLIGR